MKDKILTRVVLIMTVAVFVTVALTFLLFNMYTIDNSKKYLAQESDSLIEQLKLAVNNEDIEQRLQNVKSRDSFYKFAVFGSNKSVIYGGDQRVKNPETDEIQIVEGEKIEADSIKPRQLNKVMKNGEAFFIGKLYESGTTLNYAVKVENSHFRDGYILFVSSIDVIYNSGPYFIVVVLAVVIWIGVIFASYIALTFNIKFEIGRAHV